MKSPISGAGRYSLSPDGFSLINEDQESLEIPIEGSLGLLALGYVGLMVWRGARRQANKSESPVYSSNLSLQGHEA